MPDRTVENWEEILHAFIGSRDSNSLAAHGLRAVRRPVNQRGPWARTMFEHSHRLRHRDIAAPLILGFVQRRSMGSIRDEYLILPASSTQHGSGSVSGGV